MSSNAKQATTGGLVRHPAVSRPKSLRGRMSLLQRNDTEASFACTTGNQGPPTASPWMQTKLVVGSENDPMELEADKVSERVVSTQHPGHALGVAPVIHRSRSVHQGDSFNAAPPSVERVLRSSGQPFPEPLRRNMEHRFGYDFSRVRVHSGTAAEASARDVGAKAYTAGNAIVFGAGHNNPGNPAGQRLIAHELTHVIQQGNLGQTIPSHGPTLIQRDLEDPSRLGTVHENVRVDGPPRQTPSGSTAARKPWVDPVGADGGTAELLFGQAFSFLDNRSFSRREPTHTNDTNLDSDAVAMHQRVLARFPLIASALPDSEIERRVSLFEPATIRNDRTYLREWLDNFLPQMSEAEDFAIDDTNTHYVAMLDRLIDDSDVGPKIVTLGARQPAFTRGDGASREIFVHRRVEAGPRQLTLIHELVHFYRHPDYAAWVAASQDPDFYNEGLTEWLARKVMTSEELVDRTTYQPRVDVVEQQIARHVPEDDIARAFFRGEIWRLETRSTEARTAFETSTGISETAPETDQNTASRTGPGIFQTVESGRHYRFLNLGFDEVQPKPEHLSAFREIKAAQIESDPEVKVRFVGHASSAGSLEVNDRVARRRSTAFYQMARRERLPASRLLDAGNPPHFGETLPTATEEDAITRAMNRRVEMFLVRGES